MSGEVAQSGDRFMATHQFDEEAVFNEARRIVDAGLRSDYLQQACPDEQARARLESLLDVHERDSRFLKSPAEALHLANTERFFAESPSSTIGPYKLREQIGEGGFGIVYVADQSEPVRRRVALKIIKPGMDTQEVIARFEAERQALAMMDHPNIAKVFNAGTTDCGRPFFAMELVHGIPITEFCDQQRLSTHERLQLFIDVCRAVQHAHQKGIIHRDLKPSNVMVTMHDDHPVAKVIDFGVAKAIGQKLSEKTVYTAYGQMVGSPLYMSPEQAQLSGLDIDTRSDVYSLGVLLYELLSGTTPFEKETLQRVGFDEMRRMIREDEPPSPSARLSTLAANIRSTIADRRRIDPRKLRQSLRGDLDWIVMRCLEKDRTRRFATANGLARDIERYLADEPVEACPPSAIYRLKKLLRRNKVAAAFVVMMTVGMAALAVSNVLLKRERDAKTAALVEKNSALELAEKNEQLAKKESAKAISIADVLQQMLASADPEAAKGADYTVRQLLDDFTARLDDQLASQPDVEATIRATIGRAYQRLGVFDAAEAQLNKALDMRRQIFGAMHEDVAASLVDYSWYLADQSRHLEAEASVREALQIYRACGTAGEPLLDAMWARQRFLTSLEEYDQAEEVAKEALALADAAGQECAAMANIMHGLADLRTRQAKYADAERWARRAVELHRRLHGDQHLETAWGLSALGRALYWQEKLAEAESALREALEIFRKQYTFDHKSIAYTFDDLKRVFEARGDSAALEDLFNELVTESVARIKRDSRESASTWENLPRNQTSVSFLSSMATSLREQGRSDEAEAAMREAVSIRRTVDEDNPENAALQLEDLGRFLLDTGKPGKAEAEFRKEVDYCNEALGNHLRTSHALIWLAVSLKDQGKFADSESANRQALEIRRKLPTDEQIWIPHALNAVGQSLRMQGKLEEAEAMYREAVSVGREALGEKKLADDFPLVWSLTELAMVLQDQGKLSEAEPAWREALALDRKVRGPDHRNISTLLTHLGANLYHQGRYAEAETLFREVLPMRQQQFGREHQNVANTLGWLGSLLEKQQKFDEAEEMLREVLEIQSKLTGRDSRDTASAMVLLVPVLLAQDKFAEAEVKARESLAIHQKKFPDHWMTFYVQSALGECLLRQQEFEKAEVELISGYEGMKEREKAIPGYLRSKHLQQALDRIVLLYEQTNRPELAADWSGRAEFQADGGSLGHANRDSKSSGETREDSENQSTEPEEDF